MSEQTPDQFREVLEVRDALGIGPEDDVVARIERLHRDYQEYNERMRGRLHALEAACEEVDVPATPHGIRTLVRELKSETAEAAHLLDEARAEAQQQRERAEKAEQQIENATRALRNHKQNLRAEIARLRADLAAAREREERYPALEIGPHVRALHIRVHDAENELAEQHEEIERMMEYAGGMAGSDVELLPDLYGRLSQIDNRIAGLCDENERLRRGIVAAGDSLVKDDPAEAYHQLYSALTDTGHEELPDGPFERAREAADSGGVSGPDPGLVSMYRQVEADVVADNPTACGGPPICYCDPGEDDYHEPDCPYREERTAPTPARHVLIHGLIDEAWQLWVSTKDGEHRQVQEAPEHHMARTSGQLGATVCIERSWTSEEFADRQRVPESAISVIEDLANVPMGGMMNEQCVAALADLRKRALELLEPTPDRPFTPGDRVLVEMVVVDAEPDETGSIKLAGRNGWIERWHPDGIIRAALEGREQGGDDAQE